MLTPAHVPDTHAAIPNERSIKLAWDSMCMYQVMLCTQLCTCGVTVSYVHGIDAPTFPVENNAEELSKAYNDATEALNIDFIKHINGVA